MHGIPTVIACLCLFVITPLFVNIVYQGAMVRAVARQSMGAAVLATRVIERLKGNQRLSQPFSMGGLRATWSLKKRTDRLQEVTVTVQKEAKMLLTVSSLLLTRKKTGVQKKEKSDS